MADKPLTAVSQTNREESSKQVYADVIHTATRPVLHEMQKGRLPLVAKLAVAISITLTIRMIMKNNLPKDHTVSTRLSDPLYRRLGAYSRASGETKSGVIRSLIEKGYVKERISPEMMSAVRKLIGMATNLNQAAHQANAAGYRSAAAELTALAKEIRSILNSITYGG